MAEAGGRVELDSREGAGTTFRIVLPLLAAETGGDGDASAAGPGASGPAPAHATAPARPAGLARSLDGVRVLLVEDEPPLLKLAVRVLEKAGATVAAAASAEDALLLVAAALGGAPPDILVSDIVLSGMSGPDLGRRLREAAPDLPIVLTRRPRSWTPWRRRPGAPRPPPPPPRAGTRPSTARARRP